MLGGLFGKKPQISIEIDGNPTLNAYRDHVTSRELPAYVPGDKVTGRLELIPPPGRVISHQGIVLTLFGEYREKDGTKLMRLFERQQFLAPAGDLSIAIKTEFSFDKIVFPTASYYGSAFDVVYGVELRVVQRLKDTAQSSEFIVFMFDDTSDNVPIHNEIGMTNVLHIEFVFAKSLFDCHDVVIGAAYFILVKLRIVHMQVSLTLLEVFERGGKYIKKRSILKTCEVMDGPPCRGDHIPLRFYLGECDLWPFFQYRNSPAKVEMYLRAQLIDENGKKYFKKLRAKIVRFKPDLPEPAPQQSLPEPTE